MAFSKNRRRIGNLIDTVYRWPENALHYLRGKAEALLDAAYSAGGRTPLRVANTDVRHIASTLSALLEDFSAELAPASADERELAERIRAQTKAANRNNVTRTEAYRQVYERHPELHWAFLAHMVSRNGGWNMTDLKGELLPRLLGADEGESVFLFLERCNALIFQDAYPQLLLYGESVKRRKNLFHLLPLFHVSRFMKPFWDHFWQRRDSVMLTIALIVNEQHYIEHRVVRSKWYHDHVLGTIFFRAQSWLRLNQIVLPYAPHPERSARSRSVHPKLAGLILKDFSDLEERIGAGKTLYGILFGIPEVHAGALRFASRIKHTASRADYWPHLFAKTGKTPAGIRYAQKLQGNRLKTGAAPLYSPELAHAWTDHTMDPPDRFDWFRDLGPVRHFATVRPPLSFGMTDEYCSGLNTIELAVLAKEMVPH